MTCACGCGGDRHGERPALRVHLEYRDVADLAHLDPDALAKSLTARMREAGVGSRVVGQLPEGELSPYPSLRERLDAVRQAAQEAGERLETALRPYLERFERGA